MTALPKTLSPKTNYQHQPSPLLRWLNVLQLHVVHVCAFTGSRNIRVKLDLPTDSFSCMDDGCGIQAASFQSNVGNVRYSTSKLFTAADLDQGISTQGFRGEFLASLIDVASVHICSRAVGSSECHTKVFESGVLKSFSPSSQPLPHAGTMVMVSSFMWNRPVRQRQRAAGSLR